MSKVPSPPLRQRRSIIREGPQGAPSRPAQLPAKSHPVRGTHPTGRHGSRQAHTEATPQQQQGHYQMSAAMGASGRVGRSKGTFGSEHRWYQPTHATDKAAAAAGEQGLQDARCLLETSPVRHAKSVQRCTFGSELRWWESDETARSTHTAGADSFDHQAMLSPSDPAYANGRTKSLRALPAGQVGPPVSTGVPQRGPTNEVQWWGSAAAGQTLQQGASAAAAASASGSAHAAAVTPHNRQRSVSADRALSQARPQVSAEQAWWESDQEPSPDSTLQRIQQKHARIQSLAAMIKQRPISARTHTVKSTFGSETRWWEKSPAYDDGLSVDLQRDASSRASSPDRPPNLRPLSHNSTAGDVHTVFRGRSTFGSEARWWEPKGPSAPAAVAVQDTAAAVPSSARHLPVMASGGTLPSSTFGAADSWWRHTQERQAPPSPGTPSAPNGPTSCNTSLQAQSASPPLKQQMAHPANTTNARVQQRCSQRLHSQPWTAAAPFPKEAGSSMAQSGRGTRPRRTSMGVSRSSITPTTTPMRQSRGSITPVAKPARQSRGSIGPGTAQMRQSRGSMSRQSSVRRSRDGVASIRIERSRSGSPDGSLKGARQLNRTASSRPELQEEIRYRYVMCSQLYLTICSLPFVL